MLKFISCPSQQLCSWFGPVKILPPHYEEKHSELIVKNFSFSVPKTKVTSNTYLLTFDGKHFLIKLKHQELANPFKCLNVSISVQLIGSPNDAQKFMYHLELLDEKYCLKQFAAEQVVSSLDSNVYATEFNMELRCTNLPMPIVNKPVAHVPMLLGSNSFQTNAKYSVSVFQNNTTLPATPEDIFYEDKKVVSYKILIKTHGAEPYLFEKINCSITRELECPCCFNIMQAPIRQCELGHIICHLCGSQLNVCPKCQSSIIPTRNLFAESVAEQVISKCIYSANGCMYVSPSRSMKQHEESCNFGNVVCPLQYLHKECLWTGKIKNMLAHTREQHGDNVLENLQVVVPFTDKDFDSTDEDCFVFDFDSQLFRLLYKYQRQVFHWAVQIIGPSLNYSGYNFVLNLPKDEENKFAAKCPCLPYSDVRTVSSWLQIPLKLGVLMMDEDMNLMYHVKVVKVC